MLTKCLVTRPSYDFATRYISTWAKRVIDWAEPRSNIKIFDLERKRACRNEFETMIKHNDPQLVLLNGHGNSTTVLGNDEEPLVSVGMNELSLAGRIIYALACSCAKTLGPASVAKGALAFIGYQEDFIFLYDTEKRTRPHEDKTAALFFDPSTLIPFSLLKGSSAKEAHQHATVAFTKNIRRLLASDSPVEDVAAVRYLLWNLQNLVCIGDKNARL